MIKKYWWLIAIGVFAYYKWDLVSGWLGIKKKDNDADNNVTKPLYWTPTEEEAKENDPLGSHDGDDIPDYLQVN